MRKVTWRRLKPSTGVVRLGRCDRFTVPCVESECYRSCRGLFVWARQCPFHKACPRYVAVHQDSDQICIPYILQISNRSCLAECLDHSQTT